MLRRKRGGQKEGREEGEADVVRYCGETGGKMIEERSLARAGTANAYCG